MPARCFIGSSSTKLFIASSFGVLDISFSSLFVRGVGETWQRSILHCGWLVMEYLQHGYNNAFFSLHQAVAASVSINFQLCSCPQSWYCPQGKGRQLQSIGSSWMQRHLVNHLYLFPSFLPLVRAGEGIFCFLASCLQSSTFAYCRLCWVFCMQQLVSLQLMLFIFLSFTKLSCLVVLAFLKHRMYFGISHAPAANSTSSWPWWAKGCVWSSFPSSPLSSPSLGQSVLASKTFEMCVQRLVLSSMFAFPPFCVFLLYHPSVDIFGNIQLPFGNIL